MAAVAGNLGKALPQLFQPIATFTRLDHFTKYIGGLAHEVVDRLVHYQWMSRG